MILQSFLKKELGYSNSTINKHSQLLVPLFKYAAAAELITKLTLIGKGRR